MRWMPYRDGTQRAAYLIEELGLANTEARLIEGDDGHAVAIVFDEYGRDTKLIATAPEMLELLRAAYVQVDEGGGLEKKIKELVNRIDAK